MKEKTYAYWRTDTAKKQFGTPFSLVAPSWDEWRQVSHVVCDDIPESDVPENAVRLDADYGNPDAEYRICAWLDENGHVMHYWTNADMTKLTNESRMVFSDFYKAEDIDLRKVDTSEMTDMSKMFIGDRSLTSIDLS